MPMRKSISNLISDRDLNGNESPDLKMTNVVEWSAKSKRMDFIHFAGT